MYSVLCICVSVYLSVCSLFCRLLDQSASYFLCTCITVCSRTSHDWGDLQLLKSRWQFYPVIHCWTLTPLNCSRNSLAKNNKSYLVCCRPYFDLPMPIHRKVWSQLEPKHLQINSSQVRHDTRWTTQPFLLFLSTVREPIQPGIAARHSDCHVLYHTRIRAFCLPNFVALVIFHSNFNISY